MPALARQALRALVAAAMIALAAPPALAQATDRAAEPAALQAARQVVEGFHAVLLDMMKKAKELGLKGRFERVAPAVKDRFNLRLMAAIASGTSWTKASDAERTQLAEAFGRFSAANYASRFDSWSGQSFETVAAAPGPRGTIMVTTRINRPNDSPVKIAYVMRPASKSWQIVDVLVDDGISELAVRRSEYASVLNSRGMSALVSEIDQRTERLMQP